MSDSSRSSDDNITVQSEPIWVGFSKEVPRRKREEKQYSIADLQRDIDEKQKLNYCYSLIKERLNLLLLEDITKLGGRTSDHSYETGHIKIPGVYSNESKVTSNSSEKAEDYKFKRGQSSAMHQKKSFFDKEDFLTIYSLLHKIFIKYDIEPPEAPIYPTIHTPTTTIPTYDTPTKKEKKSKKKSIVIPDPRTMKREMNKYSKLQMLSSASTNKQQSQKVVKMPEPIPSPTPILAYDRSTTSSPQSITPTPKNHSFIENTKHLNTFIVQDTSPPPLSPRKKKKKTIKKIKPFSKVKKDDRKKNISLSAIPISPRKRKVLTPRTIDSQHLMKKEIFNKPNKRSSVIESGFDPPKVNPLTSWRRSSSIPKYPSKYNERQAPAFPIPQSAHLTKRRRASTSTSLHR